MDGCCDVQVRVPHLNAGQEGEGGLEICGLAGVLSPLRLQSCVFLFGGVFWIRGGLGFRDRVPHLNTRASPVLQNKLYSVFEHALFSV